MRRDLPIYISPSEKVCLGARDECFAACIPQEEVLSAVRALRRHCKTRKSIGVPAAELPDDSLNARSKGEQLSMETSCRDKAFCIAAAGDGVSHGSRAEESCSAFQECGHAPTPLQPPVAASSVTCHCIPFKRCDPSVQQRSEHWLAKHIPIWPVMLGSGASQAVWEMIG